jgi:site-specific recombinase XerD
MGKPGTARLLRFIASLKNAPSRQGASTHSLRHSHCSHLLASGVPLPAVSARLGHGSIRTTQEGYSHMIHGLDDEAASLLNGPYGRLP